jgi:hypothetical protein
VLRSATVFGMREDIRPLADVRGARVQTSRRSKGGITSRPALLLDGDTTLPLTPVYTSGRGAVLAAEAIDRWCAAAG